MKNLWSAKTRLALAGAFLLACSDAPPTSPAAYDASAATVTEALTLEVRLATPHDDDGAVLLMLTDAELLDIRPAHDAYRVERGTADSATGAVRIAVLGERIESGALAVLQVRSDGDRTPAVQLLQAADGENRLRPSVDGYEVAAVRVEANEPREAAPPRERTR